MMNTDSDDPLLSIFDSADELAESVAKSWLAMSMGGQPVHIALSGGSTPKHIFGYIAHSDYATSIDWRHLHFWWGDERCVPANDEESNYGEAMRLLFSHVLIPADNLHPIHGELESSKALIEFKDEMAAALPKVSDGAAMFPAFDWVILGVGEDGHTASLFPGATDYELTQSAVVAKHPLTGQERVSLSARVISVAKEVTFIALGESKSAVVNDIINQTEASKAYPAANLFSRLVASSGKVEWYLDRGSASGLA